MKPWKTLSRRRIFEAEPFVSVSVEEVELPDGQVVSDFYQVDLRSFVIVVPVMDDGRVLMLRQYKHGPRRESLTFPAGFIEAGEAPAEAVKRELLEETGCIAQDWISMGSFVDNGNQRGCEGHYFLARDCVRVQEPQSGDLEEMVEELLPPEEVDRAAREGDFAITHTVAAWGLAKLFG